MAENDISEIEQWVDDAKANRLSWSELAERLLKQEHHPGSDHNPDRDRGRRCGFGEVIFGSGKSVDSIQVIANQLLDAGQSEILATRIDASSAAELASAFAHTRYDPQGRTLRMARNPIAPVRVLTSPAPHLASPAASIAVVTAGSTDRPVAQEAVETLRWMGVDAALLCDLGVAGPYRLLAHLEQLRQCAAIVAVAGMEGALVSVVGGLVACPVIAVPTSVGYGSNFEGITTLLSMMSSCAAGVTVVNIDAGFKGGYVAGLIAHRVASQISPPASPGVHRN